MLKWMKHLRDKGHTPLVALGMVIAEFDARAGKQKGRR